MALSEWQREFVKRWYPEVHQEKALRLVEETGYNEESFLRDQKIIDKLIDMKPSEEELQAQMQGIIGAYRVSTEDMVGPENPVKVIKELRLLDVSLIHDPLPGNEIISVADNFDINYNEIKVLKDRIQEPLIMRTKPATPHPSFPFRFSDAKVWYHARDLVELPWWRETFIAVKQCPAILVGEDKNRQCQLWREHEKTTLAHAYALADRSILRWTKES